MQMPEAQISCSGRDRILCQVQHPPASSVSSAHLIAFCKWKTGVSGAGTTTLRHTSTCCTCDAYNPGHSPPVAGSLRPWACWVMQARRMLPPHRLPRRLTLWLHLLQLLKLHLEPSVVRTRCQTFSRQRGR